MFSLLQTRGWGSETTWFTKDVSSVSSSGKGPSDLEFGGLAATFLTVFYSTFCSCFILKSLMSNLLRVVTKVNLCFKTLFVNLMVWTGTLESNLVSLVQWFSMRGPQPAASASPGSWLEKNILGAHARSIRPETLRVRPIHLGFKSPPGDFKAFWSLGSPAWPIQTQAVKFRTRSCWPQPF